MHLIGKARGLNIKGYREMNNYKAGDKIKKVYPYQYFEYMEDSIFGLGVGGHWAMGCRTVQEGDELFHISDGEGFIEIEILALVEMPRKMKSRVLYKFDQILPEGNIKKSSKVYTVSTDVFNNLINKNSYRHDYEVIEEQ